MRNPGFQATLVLVGLSLTGALDSIGGPVGWHLGPRRAQAVSKLVIPAAMGFSGTLLGEVGHNDDGKVLDPKWLFFRIKVIKVVSYDERNKVRLTPEDLTAQWRDNFASIGPANGARPLPELAAGDLVLVTGFQNEGHIRQTQTIAFKPGEEEANCYTFLKKVENGARVSVVLRKIGEEKTFALATQKDARGKMAPAADLLTAVDGLKENTVVMVKLDHNVLKTIKPYEPPDKGEFVKLTTQKVGTRTVQAVELKDASGTVQTLPVSAQEMAGLLRAARAFKAGAAIEYRTETNDQGTWLTDIHPPL
jgi:hypothetical protein